MLHILNPCNGALCHLDNGQGVHSLVTDRGPFAFDAWSGGRVLHIAADTDGGNSIAGEVSMHTGSGTSKMGGSRGDFFAFADNAAGVSLLCFLYCFHICFSLGCLLFLTIAFFLTDQNRLHVSLSFSLFLSLLFLSHTIQWT